MQELAKSFSELVNSLNGGAKGIAEAMQHVAPDAWRIAVYQAKLNGIRYMVMCLLIAAGLAVASVALRAQARRLEAIPSSEKTRDTIEGEGVYVGLSWFSLGVASLFAIFGVLCNIDTILNPEYEAASAISSRFLGK